MTGLEPVTCCLRNSCSTTELHRRVVEKNTSGLGGFLALIQVDHRAHQSFFGLPLIAALDGAKGHGDFLSFGGTPFLHQQHLSALELLHGRHLGNHCLLYTSPSPRDS